MAPKRSIISTILTVLAKVKPADYTISTWLTLGATLQCILVSLLPRNIALLPPILFLLYRLTRGYLIATHRLPNPLEDDIALKRTTWQIPESADGSPATTASSSSIVVLVLAATWSHPNGSFSPGSRQLGEYFAAMWADAASNRETYGYLGNTPTMTSQDDGNRADAAGKTLLYLSYWKTLEGLHKFAHGSVHMKGQMWWDGGAMSRYTHIGMMHEVYEVPKGNWENVFHNFRPFGICKSSPSLDFFWRLDLWWAGTEKKNKLTILQRMRSIRSRCRRRRRRGARRRLSGLMG